MRRTAQAVAAGGRSSARGRAKASTDKRTARPMATKSDRRWLRTIRVKSRSLVVSRTTPFADGEAAEKTGVRSGALRALVTDLPVAFARTAFGQACSSSRRGSMKSSSGFAPTKALKPRSMARAASLCPFLRVGVAQLVGRSGQPPTVELECAVGPVKANPAVARSRQALAGPNRATAGGHSEHARGDIAPRDV